MVLVSPDVRGTFANHGELAFYVGPLLKHYRCVNTYVIATQAFRISDSVAYFPANYILPNSDPASILDKSITELITKLDSIKSKPADATTVTSVIENFKAQLTKYSTEINSTPRSQLERVQEFVSSPTINPNDLVTINPNIAQTRSMKIIANNQTINLNKQLNQSPLTNNVTSTEQKSSINNIDTTNDFSFDNLFTNSFANSGTMVSNSEAKHGFDKAGWIEADNNELIKLFDITKTLVVIPHNQKPINKKATYYNPQRKYKSDGSRRTRGTAGGDLIIPNGPVKSDVASIQSVKILINSILSTPGARAATMDIDDFFVSGTLLPESEYMYLTWEQLTPEFQERFKDPDLWKDNKILARIDKTIYGLPQSSLLSQRDLVKLLAEHGYHQLKCDECIFSNADKSVQFALVVDDFLSKYTNLTNFEHLIQTLKSRYGLKVDMEAKKYLGMKLDWDYKNGTMEISMPDYVKNALTKLNYTSKNHETHSAIKFVKLNYAKAQQVMEDDTTRPLDATEKKHLQSIIGIFLYYARIIDCLMLPAVSMLSTKQSKPTITDMAAADYLMDYAHTYPDIRIKFTKSDMILMSHTDSTYLSEPNASSRVGGHHYFGNKPESTQIVNGNVSVLCKLTKTKVSSACASEYVGLFENANEPVIL